MPVATPSSRPDGSYVGRVVTAASASHYLFDDGAQLVARNLGNVGHGGGLYTLEGERAERYAESLQRRILVAAPAQAARTDQQQARERSEAEELNLRRQRRRGALRR